MIPYSAIVAAAEQYGVHPATIEQDYCLTWLLLSLSGTALLKKSVFYGGTAIRKVYFHHRFSEDLDLTSDENISARVIDSSLQSAIQRAKANCNIEFRRHPALDIYERSHAQIILRFNGFPELAGAKEIKIDIVHGQPYSGNPIRVSFRGEYPDVKSKKISLRVYSLAAIAADKIDSILSQTRTQPRDVFDIWHIFKHRELDIFELQKGFDKKYPVSLKVALKELPAYLDRKAYEGLWKARLAPQTPDLPEYKRVVEELQSGIRQMLRRLAV